MVQFFDPTQEAEIKRRRLIGEQLLKQGVQKPTEMVGGYAVPQSSLQGLSQGLGSVLGAYAQGSAGDQEKEMASQKQKLLVEALQQKDAKSAGGVLAQNPEYAKEALDIAFPRSAFGATPAALQLANEVARLEASGDTEGANRIREFAKTQEKGQVLTPEGIKTVPGYADAVSAKEAAKVGGKLKGTSAANAEIALPAATDKANYAVQLIDEMVGNPDKNIPEHPGMRGAVGFSSIIPNRPGSQAASFENRLKQIGGQQFLEAFAALKGGGQITEIEGAKATAAIARMQASNSEEEFINAAREFQGIIKQGLARQQAQAGGAPNAATIPPSAATTGPQEGATATNPQTGAKVRFTNGQWMPM